MLSITKKLKLDILKSQQAAIKQSHYIFQWYSNINVLYCFTKSSIHITIVVMLSHVS